MIESSEAQDRAVRVAVYESTVERGVPPGAAELATLTGLPVAEVRASLERLAAGRVLVLQDASREILMAAPFSAVPTPFLVHAGARSWHANCVWDALGVPAMLRSPARVETACPCCGEAMTATVEGGELLPLDGVIHFAVPARRWWQDIVYA